MEKLPSAAALLAAAVGVASTLTPLSGDGLRAECEMKVVSCNYAHLYSGTFSWTSNPRWSRFVVPRTSASESHPRRSDLQ